MQPQHPLGFNSITHSLVLSPEHERTLTALRRQYASHILSQDITNPANLRLSPAPEDRAAAAAQARRNNINVENPHNASMNSSDIFPMSPVSVATTGVPNPTDMSGRDADSPINSQDGLGSAATTPNTFDIQKLSVQPPPTSLPPGMEDEMVSPRRARDLPEGYTEGVSPRRSRGRENVDPHETEMLEEQLQQVEEEGTAEYSGYEEGLSPRRVRGGDSTIVVSSAPRKSVEELEEGFSPRRSRGRPSEEVEALPEDAHTGFEEGVSPRRSRGPSGSGSQPRVNGNNNDTTFTTVNDDFVPSGSTSEFIDYRQPALPQALPPLPPQSTGVPLAFSTYILEDKINQILNAVSRIESGQNSLLQQTTVLGVTANTSAICNTSTMSTSNAIATTHAFQQLQAENAELRRSLLLAENDRDNFKRYLSTKEDAIIVLTRQLQSVTAELSHAKETILSLKTKLHVMESSAHASRESSGSRSGSMNVGGGGSSYLSSSVGNNNNVLLVSSPLGAAGVGGITNLSSSVPTFQYSTSPRRPL